VFIEYVVDARVFTPTSATEIIKLFDRSKVRSGLFMM
jgi:hypothetical protein